MAALTPRGFDDIILDRIKSILEAYRDEQAAINPSASFDVARDRRRPIDPTDPPLVNIWGDSSSPASPGSTARAHGMEVFTINVDCTVCISGASAEPGSIDPEEAAAYRSAYLKEQVRQALYALISTDFGYDPPSSPISSKSWPTWQVLKDESGNPEEAIYGGRWSFDITYAWEPHEIEGVALSEISVDAGILSAYYHLNQARSSGGIAASGSSPATVE